jgi:UDP-3-O-[3-hydroxymyristoyl] glucosamine N-acyltransferase
LVQIAHNVEIGKDCVIVAQAGIAGSTKIGNNVTVGGQSGIVGHVTIADNVVIAARSGVTKSILQPGIYSGFPAKEHNQEKKLIANIARLPELKEQIKELYKKVINKGKVK